MGEEDEELIGLSADELLRLGIDRFNAGHYFEAHEAWEEVWLDAPRELRNFYQGLIQVAAAFVHLQRNQFPGTVKLLREALWKLESYPPVQFGVELAPLIASATLIQSLALELGEKRIEELDRSLLPRIESTGS